MTMRPWTAFAALAAVAACGGTTDGPIASTDGGPAQDAASGDGSPQADAGLTDAQGDGGYAACMSATGVLDASLKHCQTDTDCVLKQELTDCCGTLLYVGVSAAAAATFAACEAAWEAHFPGCGCASNKVTTEDGKAVVLGADAGGPKVHCVDFTSNGGVCMSYSP